MRTVVAILVLSELLAGCDSPSGLPAANFISPAAESAYIPLHGSSFVVFAQDAAAMVLGGGVAVTNAHNANLIESGAVIGRSRDYDLLFFRTDKRSPGIESEPPRPGQRVVAYGQYQGELRVAEGNIVELDTPVKPECDGCAVQTAFTFAGNAGPGFSGGPVLDAESGRLVGIVFGYNDTADGSRIMYAYTMERVQAERKKLGKQPVSDKD